MFHLLFHNLYRVVLYLTIYLPVCLSLSVSVHLYVYHSVSVCFSDRPSVYVATSIYLSIRLSACQIITLMRHSVTHLGDHDRTTSTPPDPYSATHPRSSPSCNTITIILYILPHQSQCPSMSLSVCRSFWLASTSLIYTRLVNISPFSIRSMCPKASFFVPLVL